MARNFFSLPFRNFSRKTASNKDTMGHRCLLIFLVCLIQAGYSCFYFHQSFNSHPHLYVLLFLVLYVASIGSWKLLRDIPETKAKWIIISVGILFHLTGLISFPFLENDFFRYLWEGKILLEGQSPYEYYPLAHELKVHAANYPYFTKIGFPYISTVYPPVAQYAFAFSQVLKTDSIFIWKLLMTLSSVGSMCLLFPILKHFNCRTAAAVFYAWNPLVIKELANSAHIDSLMIFFLLLSFFFLIRNINTISIFFLTLASFTKLLPILFIPYFIKRVGKKYLFLMGLLSVIIFIPFFKDGAHLLNGLRIFSKEWEFNPGIHTLMKFLFGNNGQIILIIGFFILYGQYYRRTKTMFDIWHFGMISTALFIIISPVIDPWYLTVLIPWVLVRPSPAWIWLLGMVSASYLFYMGEHMRVYYETVEWIGFYGLILYEICTAKRRQLA